MSRHLACSHSAYEDNTPVQGIECSRGLVYHADDACGSGYTMALSSSIRATPMSTGILWHSDYGKHML